MKDQLYFYCKKKLHKLKNNGIIKSYESAR